MHDPTGTTPTASVARGAHPSPGTGRCLMEHVAAVAGEPFSDHPRCTHPALAALVAQVNDRVSDGARDELLGLVPDLASTATDDPRAAWLLVGVCARHTLVARPGDRAASRIEARACRSSARWGRLPVRGRFGTLISLRALPDLTAAMHGAAVAAGPAGSTVRDRRLIALLTEAVDVLRELADGSATSRPRPDPAPRRCAELSGVG